jgi:hypothetical protein
VSSKNHTVDNGETRTLWVRLANATKVSLKKSWFTNLEALLDCLGGVLIHGVFGSTKYDEIDGALTILRSAVFTDVLDTPVSKLTMNDDVNAVENLVNAWALEIVSSEKLELSTPQTLSTSKQFSKMF